MSFSILFIIILAVGIVFSGILLLKQSAKKFNLTEEQLKTIKARNKQLEKDEDES